MYTAQFSAVAVTAAQDLFEITAPADAVVRIHQIEFAQYTDTGDAQEEIFSIKFKRGQTTSGSGGSSVTPALLQFGFPAAGSTVEANNTTIASTGTISTLYSSAWNIRSPFLWLPTPEMRIHLSPSQRFTVENLTAPTDSVTMNGTIVFEELGG